MTAAVTEKKIKRETEKDYKKITNLINPTTAIITDPSITPA